MSVLCLAWQKQHRHAQHMHICSNNSLQSTLSAPGLFVEAGPDFNKRFAGGGWLYQYQHLRYSKFAMHHKCTRACPRNHVLTLHVAKAQMQARLEQPYGSQMRCVGLRRACKRQKWADLCRTWEGVTWTAKNTPRSPVTLAGTVLPCKAKVPEMPALQQQTRRSIPNGLTEVLKALPNSWQMNWKSRLMAGLQQCFSVVWVQVRWAEQSTCTDDHTLSVQHMPARVIPAKAIDSL